MGEKYLMVHGEFSVGGTIVLGVVIVCIAITIFMAGWCWHRWKG